MTVGAATINRLDWLLIRKKKTYPNNENPFFFHFYAPNLSFSLALNLSIALSFVLCSAQCGEAPHFNDSNIFTEYDSAHFLRTFFFLSQFEYKRNIAAIDRHYCQISNSSIVVLIKMWALLLLATLQIRNFRLFFIVFNCYSYHKLSCLQIIQIIFYFDSFSLLGPFVE